MDRIEWGPTHACSRCQKQVTYQFRSDCRRARLFDAGTNNRHRCSGAVLPPEIRSLECLCGSEIDIIGAVRYERDSERVHVCALAPAVSSRSMAFVPSSARIPRGAILL